ncbi:hypothetical protein GR254_14365 [Mycobacterium tuberculosis]|nr:hypothetical protein [Mycobacterium tuberculosis]
MTVASRTSADPLGPDSLTWKYFGDLRTGMMGVGVSDRPGRRRDPAHRP